MKKLMIVLVAIMAVISSVQAAFGDKETYVIKDDNMVRVFHIKDVTKKSYSWTEFEVTSENRTNMSASDLKSLEIPEGAWKLCSSSESGVYSTKEVKLATENKKLKDTNKDLTTENQDLSYGRWKFQTFCIGFFLLSIILLALLIRTSIKFKKERAR